MSLVSDLLRLQEIDLTLKQIESRTASLPQIENLKKIAATKKKLSSELIHLSGKRKDFEMDIADNRSQKTEAEQQTQEVQAQIEAQSTDYRALSDIELQLSNLAKKCEKLDFDHTALVEQLNAVLKQEEKSNDYLAQLADLERTQTAVFKSEIAAANKQREELQAEREKLVARLDPALYTRYSAAQKRYGDRVIETLEGNTPSSCRVSLQESNMAELKRKTGIATCPYCHRILILPDALQSED